MKHIFYIILCLMMISCGQSPSAQASGNKSNSICSDKCEAKSSSAELSCKLTTPELEKRKVTVLESLKKKVLERKELSNGYAFKFGGTNEMIDELTDFIKTERVCCSFFTFDLSISGDQKEVWLNLTGPAGVKEMIRDEIGL